MKKEESINKFYEFNSIDFENCCNEESADFDERIISLSDNVDLWLKNIDEDDHEIFLDVLSRFTYFTEVLCQKRFKEIVDMINIIIKTYNISLNKVLFVTVDSPDATASGGDNVRSDLLKRNIRILSRKQVVISSDNYDFSQISDYDCIVFIDDIISTGFTLWRSAEKLLNEIPTNEICNKIFICTALTYKKRGIKFLKKKFKSYDIEIKCIYDASWCSKHPFDRNSKEYNVFLKYENIINSYYQQFEKNYVMGFSQCGITVGFYYNTPNDTISSFWSSYNNHPPFKRDDKKAFRPNIDSMKEMKKESDKIAYNSAVERNAQSNV